MAKSIFVIIESRIACLGHEDKQKAFTGYELNLKFEKILTKQFRRMNKDKKNSTVIETVQLKAAKSLSFIKLSPAVCESISLLFFFSEDQKLN